MKVKLILPSLVESKSSLWRPVKYSLFPPLGLATLASWLQDEDDVELIDQHVQKLDIEDQPDLVLIQVYITNAYRAYDIARHYRKKGSYVVLGGLHVTALPEEAAQYADTLITGPAEEAFPRFLKDFRNGQPQKHYVSKNRSLHNIPIVRRDLIKRERYLVPNSLVISRGCPHHCDFCYKDAFYKGGRSFYTQKVDDALQEIDRLPGRHLYFLDDHLLANRSFSESLFEGMRGMNRVFQGAATVDSILKDDLIEKAAEAGLRSVFVGFETFSPENLKQSNKSQNLKRNYEAAVKRLHHLGIMINGSFVFGLDHDGPEVFDRTVEWGVKNGITTATYHILTPYPGTRLFQQMEMDNRITSSNWNNYTTRQVVYQPKLLSSDALEAGYWKAYRNFYSWSNIWKASMVHDQLANNFKHLLYTGGWKKMEPLWRVIINSGALNHMTPLLESILNTSKPSALEINHSLSPELQ